MEMLASVNWPLQAVSVLLYGMSLYVQKLIGDKRVLGQYLGILSQLLWITFGLMTGSYPTIVAAVLYAAMYWRNARKWVRESI